ncbi:MAG: hypothetical protein DMF27_08110 [Verrucomicrobia bacterium]|nr:MAG: hypothetical protein DMF27_08110 [Verrucomicrobiota bacterium]
MLATLADGNDETRLFRVGRRGEFLEARIVAERIEHWIEPLSPSLPRAREDPTSYSVAGQVT